MRNKIFIAAAVAFGIFICVVIGMAVYSVVAFKTIATFPKTIFTEISDLELLNEYEHNSTTRSDRYIGELEPEESYVITVKYNNRKYDIYAYVFSSSDDAFQYYYNASEQDSASYATCLYHLYTHFLTESRFCAYNDNIAYRVEGKGFAKFCDFMSWLGNNLPVNIRDEYYNEYGVWLPG